MSGLPQTLEPEPQEMLMKHITDLAKKRENAEKPPKPELIFKDLVAPTKVPKPKKPRAKDGTEPVEPAGDMDEAVKKSLNKRSVGKSKPKNKRVKQRLR